MEGSDLSRSTKRHEARDDALHVIGRVAEGAVSAAKSLSAARIELDALEAELAYRGPERRNGLRHAGRRLRRRAR